MNFLAEWRRAREATDTDGSSSVWTPKAQRPPSPDQKSVYMTEKTQPMNVAASGGGGYPHPGAPKPGGASFNDSPQIANVKPHKAYKIHVATKSDKIKRTPGIVRRVVTEVARLYYATGERPGFSLQGIRGKGGWDEYTVAIGPLKDSPLALAMYRVDVFMKAFTFGARYFPKSGSSLEETRRLARQAKNLEAQRKKEGTDLYDWVKEWSDNCYDFQDDDVLRDLYQQYNKAEDTSGSYCFSPYVQSCSVSEDRATFFFEPDIHVTTHGYTTRDNGTADYFSFDERKPYVQLVKQAINSNSELAYDLDIIHIACCAYALVQSLPRDRVCDVREIDPVLPEEKMELLSPLQYGLVFYCVGCQREHLSGGVTPDWAEIDPTVVGTGAFPSMHFAFDLPTMGAPDLNLDVEWSRALVENFDETLVLDVATGKCVATLYGHSDYVRCGVHCTFVMILLRRRSVALPCFRTGGASCLVMGLIGSQE